MIGWVKKNKFRTFVVILILLIGSLIFFKSNNPVTMVRQIELKKRVVEKTLSASGAIKSDSQADLSFVTAGVLSNTYVEEGQEVKQGQILAELDNLDAYYALKSKRDLRDISLRDKEIYIEENEANLSGEDEYNINLRRYDELISKAEADYQAQFALYNKTVIYAPFDGLIIQKSYTAGETVTAGNSVYKLSNLNNLIFEASVDQEDFGYLKQAMQVNIKLDAYPLQRFSGTITKLPQYADETTNSFVLDINVIVDNSKTNGFPVTGLTGDAYVILENTPSEVNALNFDEINFDEEDKAFVWVLDENQKLKKKYVELGLEGDIYTEIKDDISETIVTPVNAEDDVQEGFKVRIINE